MTCVFPFATQPLATVAPGAPDSPEARRFGAATFQYEGRQNGWKGLHGSTYLPSTLETQGLPGVQAEPWTCHTLSSLPTR